MRNIVIPSEYGLFSKPEDHGSKISGKLQRI